jgi:hypothetical protein
MEYAPPQRFPLAQFMSDKEPVWKTLVKEHDLLDYSFQEAAAWPFGEAIFNLEYDVMSDTTRSRRFGFQRSDSFPRDSRRKGASTLQKQRMT